MNDDAPIASAVGAFRCVRSAGDQSTLWLIMTVIPYWREVAMAQDWIPMDRPSAAILEFKLDERRQKITQEVLQQPDYPSLPQCPECGKASEEIVDRRDLDDAVLIDFKPCGHRFRVEPPSLDTYL